MRLEVSYKILLQGVRILDVDCTKYRFSTLLSGRSVNIIIWYIISVIFIVILAVRYHFAKSFEAFLAEVSNCSDM